MKFNNSNVVTLSTYKSLPASSKSIAKMSLNFRWWKKSYFIEIIFDLLNFFQNKLSDFTFFICQWSDFWIMSYFSKDLYTYLNYPYDLRFKILWPLIKIWQHLFISFHRKKQGMLNLYWHFRFYCTNRFETCLISFFR